MELHSSAVGRQAPLLAPLLRVRVDPEAGRDLAVGVADGAGVLALVTGADLADRQGYQPGPGIVSELHFSKNQLCGSKSWADT